MSYSVEPARIFLHCTITRRRKLGAHWFRVGHVKSRIFPLQFEEVGDMLVAGCPCTHKERDLIFPPQIEEEAACILVLGCPCVEHDQTFQIQLEICLIWIVRSFNPRFPYYFAFQQKFNEN